ncbi:hypothetical protein YASMINEVIRUS_156 [Yasminevirus sp. GU-2018]|uniref:Uncharacterized protein n=1 Tax=Yasminevirus sp. GU-2018 TaxID=2420051 RepID=A0A5K0U8M5_9VIRU|nr:hypothetical protein YASMINEVIRUS_156 [Yasminevirus sp. GU-2018]
MESVPVTATSELNRTVLTKKHAKQLAEIFRSGRMIPEFFEQLFVMFEKRDTQILDMIKEYEREIKSVDESQRENIVAFRTKFVTEFFVRVLESSPMRGLHKVCRVYQFTSRELSLLLKDEFAEYDSFVVIGCPESTDIDVVCFVREADVCNGHTKELSPDSVDKLRSELNTLGYSPDKGMDINCVYVDPKTRTIVASSKGGTETQNIINATWMHHKQVMTTTTSEPNSEALPYALVLHPVDDITFTHEEVHDKIRAFAKYALDYSEETCRNYQKLRQIKSDLYTAGGDSMIVFMENLMDWIVHNPAHLKEHGLTGARWNDRFKAMVMKLIQIVLVWRLRRSVYVKYDLAESVKDIFCVSPGSEDGTITGPTVGSLVSGAHWYLSRGRRGEFCESLFPILLKEYQSVVREFNSEKKFTTLTFECADLLRTHQTASLCPAMSSTMMRMFFDSPEVFTPEFESEWKSDHGNASINSQFVLKSSDEKEFYNYYSSAPSSTIDSFRKSFIFVDQRTSEWLDMLQNKFVCGSNSGTISTVTFQGNYNLIRGSVIEMMAMKLFNPEMIGLRNFKMWSLGFIVDENKHGASGFAPDAVLISSNDDLRSIELILIEIKGLKTLRHNSDYYRGLHLATSQIQSAKSILGSTETLTVRRGLILLCSVENSQFTIEAHLRDLV